MPSIRVRIKRTFEKYLRTQILQILEILPGNRQSPPSGPASTEKWRTSQEQQEANFDLPRPPPPGTSRLQTIPHPRDRRAGLVPGVAGGGKGG